MVTSQTEDVFYGAHGSLVNFCELKLASREKIMKIFPIFLLLTLTAIISEKYLDFSLILAK